jgi:Mn2+/Fe2+ NRAMP family transporter
MRVRELGPAFILAAVVLGPGSITLATLAGRAYGYRLIWVTVFASIFMMGYVFMASRIAMVTHKTLLQVTREYYGRWLAGAAGFFAFLSILAFQTGNTAAVGFAGEALLGQKSGLWSLCLSATAIGLLFLPDLFRLLERVVKWVVGAMICSFFAVLVLVGVDLPAVMWSLVPGFPDSEAIFLALGMAATTFSIAAAAYQSYLVREKLWTADNWEIQTRDSLLAIAALGFISLVILLTSARVAGAVRGSELTAMTMAKQLEPLAGVHAYYLFNIGFFLASFSSLVVNPLIGATLLADGLGWDASLRHRPVRLVSVGILVLSLLIVLGSGGSPLVILRSAQAMAVVAFPLLGWLIFRLAASRRVMGSWVSGFWLNLIGVLGYLTIIGIVLNYIFVLLAV